MLRIAAIICMWILASGQPTAAEVTPINIPHHVSEIINSRSGVFIRTLRESYRAIRCGKTVCVKAAAVKGARRPSVHGLPDGEIATYSKGDIRSAWYAAPTRRYGHGVLGDAIEAGALIVIDNAGKQHQLVLPETHVFEDITPRIFDLTGDNRNEIVTIRTSLRKGAAVAIYGLRDGALQLIASSPEIGRSHRWLNISGIAKYFGHNRPIITWVETPHIGGVLHMAVLKGNSLEPFRSPQRGFSNHAIGSGALKLAATSDFDGDGKLDLAVPSATRMEIRFLMANGSSTAKLPDRISQNMGVFFGGVIVATESGALFHVRP